MGNHGLYKGKNMSLHETLNYCCDHMLSLSGTLSVLKDKGFKPIQDNDDYDEYYTKYLTIGDTSVTLYMDSNGSSDPEQNDYWVTEFDYN
jgi:hypothetical protein